MPNAPMTPGTGRPSISKTCSAITVAWALPSRRTQPPATVRLGGGTFGAVAVGFVLDLAPPSPARTFSPQAGRRRLAAPFQFTVTDIRTFLRSMSGATLRSPRPLSPVAGRELG